MKVRAAHWVVGCVAAGSVAMLAGGLVLAYLDRHAVPAALVSWDFQDVLYQVVLMPLPVVGYVLATRRPDNRIGWLFLVAGLALGLQGLAQQYGLYALVAAHGSWPAGRAVLWLYNSSLMVPLALLASVFLLFPTGRLRSRRWRPAGWLVAGTFTLGTAGMLVVATAHWRDPFFTATQAGSSRALGVVLGLTLVALAVSAAALVARFVLARGEERLQLKWFVAAALLLVVTFIAGAAANTAAVWVLTDLAFLCLWTAIAIAVLKYRLYEIDIVISKAVLYGTLAVFITAVYVALVAGVGTLVGNRRSPLLAALAATVVAVAFQPVRQWAGRLANRVVYGRRATPYQVLSDFARRIGGAYADTDVLPRMAQIVAAGTGAQQVVVWLRVDDELRPEAWAGGGHGPAALTVDGHVLPPLPDADLSVPVMHEGELLGAITITMPRAEPLRPAGAQLVAEVAAQAGLVLSNTALIEDLRASRQRLVSAQDEERRRLERNIHDGAQQDLVALAIKARLGTTAEDVAQARQICGELQADAAGALENLRELARGIYPPLLADLGLVAALNAQANKSAVPVTVDADGIGRFGQDTEAAVYFCCLEALQNIAKYAHATSARICLRAEDGTLRFTVSDDGIGYDARHTPMGSGLRNMADRLAALGGRLDVKSAPGQGTTITGHLPALSTSGNHQGTAITDRPDNTTPLADNLREHALGTPRQTLAAGPDATDR